MGLIHRLDVACSGLLLVTRTHVAGYSLHGQLHTNALIRDYAVHCHAGASRFLCSIFAMMYRCWRMGKAALQGMSSRTQVSVLSYGALGTADIGPGFGSEL